MNRRRALGAGVASLATALSGCLDVTFGPSETEAFSDSYAVSDGTLVVSNRNGDVTVTESTDERLVVSGEKFANSQEGLDSVRIEVRKGERFVVEAVFESGAGFSNRGVDMTVEVPAGVAVDSVTTGNGTGRYRPTAWPATSRRRRATATPPSRISSTPPRPNDVR